MSAIPHPAAYSRLVRIIHDNWANLAHICNNDRSRIRPRSHPDGRILVMNYADWNAKTIGHIRESFGSRFLVKADIANFFGSIYTHAVPWAIAGIPAAKQAIGATTWYNDLDRALQLSKRRETNGVAVGPATSNIIAEVILGKVDLELKSYLFHRYIDDYTAFCESPGQAKAFIRDLERALRKYKLALNHGKTRIVELPLPVSSEWVLEIRRKVRALPDTVRPAQAVDFIDFALVLAQRSGDPNSIKYAFRALAAKSRHYWTDSSITEYGLLLWSSFPAVIPALEPFIRHAASRSGPLVLQEKLLAILDDSLEAGRTDIACWATYYVDAIGGALPEDSVRNAVSSLDCLAMLTIFRFASASQRVGLTNFAKRIVAAPDMHDRHRYWLFLYELFRLGYLSKVQEETGVYRVLSHGVAFMPSLI